MGIKSVPDREIGTGEQAGAPSPGRRALNMWLSTDKSAAVLWYLCLWLPELSHKKDLGSL